MPKKSRHNHLIVALDILKSLELPLAQQSDLCGNVLLALCGIRPEVGWQDSSNNWMRIHDIIQFLGNHYHIHYAENSRETIRKQALHYFRAAAIIEDNGLATNSPNYRYRLDRREPSAFSIQGLSRLGISTIDVQSRPSIFDRAIFLQKGKAENACENQ